MGKRGAFIVIEGLDKSGKSTQAATLLRRLQDSQVSAKLIKFPDRTTTIGKMVDSYLRSESELDDHVIHLLFSANRWELASSIEESLKQGETIICDRYAFSGIAFSASKIRPGSHSYPLLDYAWCRSPDIGLPAPDIAIMLDVSQDVAQARGGYGEERYEKEDVQRRVRDVFVRIGEEFEGSGGKWLVVDADEKPDEVQTVIWDAVKDLVKGIEGPLEKLWDDKREAKNVDALYM
ncbi:thymidylate kinase-domain-containing protein [Irpex rosettiformis]|uniref:Thymidylate kinase-domain-containing protein n=1 Tax=Irpex rosettiformis TaxID=378272 RepID=A0ACB8TV15_9APHY|nr:thymidylate kinase-domain-containing protein [Irpex rosettiformis]